MLVAATGRLEMLDSFRELRSDELVLESEKFCTGEFSSRHETFG